MPVELNDELDRLGVARLADLASAPVTSLIVPDTTAGLSATTDGQYFSVPSAESSEFLVLYRNKSGAASEVKRYPSATIFDSLTPDGYEWAVVDGRGNASIGIAEDGTFMVSEQQTEHLKIGDSEQSEDQTPNYVWSIKDDNGKIAIGVRHDGSVEVSEIIKSGSQSSDSLVERHGGVYSHQLNFINNAGQSLAAGYSGSSLTTTQEYDNVGFAAQAISPTALLPLTVGNTQTYPGTYEAPLFGMLGYIKELIEKENGLTYQSNDYQLVAGNNGSGGAPIAEIVKGGVRGMYERAITQVQSCKNIADGSSRSVSFQAVTWTQGESDSFTSKNTYKSLLRQMAADFNADGKAITGQHNTVQLISYQTSRYDGRDTVMPAQLELSEEVESIHLATPIYFMSFIDTSGPHLDAVSTKWLGAYYGLVYKRVIIDKQPWAPLKPIQHTIIGSAIDLYFNKDGLTFDTELMPPQTNSGFTVLDGTGASVTISSVSIISPNRVRIVCAVPPQAGWVVKYGHIRVSGKTAADGSTWQECGGNLRDSQGDTLIYSKINKPMHNWCVIFSRIV